MASAVDSGSAEALAEVLGEALALEEAEAFAGADLCPFGIIPRPGRCLTAFLFLMASPTGLDIRPIPIPPGHRRPAVNKNKKNKRVWRKEVRKCHSEWDLEDGMLGLTRPSG